MKYLFAVICPISFFLASHLLPAGHRLALSAAEGRPATVPAATSQQARLASQIENGKATFRNACSFCHGLNAQGGSRAPSLVSGRLNHGDSDEAMLTNILHGIPGTAMPANDVDELEARDVIAYLRSLQKPASAPVTGNAESGRKLFFGQAVCSRCHMVSGQGGRLGPDLSRVGAMRPRDYLVESIRTPDAVIAERFVTTDFGVNPPNYELVTVTTRQGTRFSGVILNEDSFSLQFMDDREQYHSWPKSELQSIVHEKRSPMPAYDTQQLSEAQLDDLLAYLISLTGASK